MSATVGAVDLRGPLPEGTVVLEASAGTGKTATVAGLVTRYVAQGGPAGPVPLERLLVITFGRAATGELRTRVRERLATTRRALADPATARTSRDAVVALLADGPPQEVAARAARLDAALADFDAATVATTHEFCLAALHGLGTAGDLDPGTVLTEDLSDLLTEVVDDLYVRAYARPDAPAPPFPAATAHALARAAVLDEARLEPADAPPGSVAAARVGFARAVRRELAARTRAQRLLGFDDLLRRLRDALCDPVSGPTACARLRSRYDVVLVDEFQDTDPVQWDVLRTAFAGACTLVLIGDPKQAIYAFRGADVHAYLAARAAATGTGTLDTSWRSDPDLLAGLQRLLRGAALGDPEIVVHPLRAGHATPALDPPGPPVRLRVVQREGLPTAGRGVQAGAARAAVATDVAAQVVALLREEASVTPRGGGPSRPLAAGDVAVLVRTRPQAQLVRAALLAAGVPVVLPGSTSVFGTPAAADWQVLLEALEQPHRTGRVRRLALTALVGRSAAQVDEGGDEAADALALQVRAWAGTLGERGVAALFAAVARDHGLAARLLARPDGERHLTDLRHVAEVLHAAATQGQLGLTGLLAWLRHRVGEAGGDGDRERSRRLDTDTAAVQVVTVHGSKGLEFPVVLVPFAYAAAGGGSDERLPRVHAADGERVLFVGGSDDPGYTGACRRQDEEEAGEELRLLYVAVTRAVSRLVLWWVPTARTATGPLHRLLFCTDPAAAPLSVPVPDDAAALRALRALGLTVELVDPQERPALLAAAPSAPVALSAPSPPRQPDTAWRRTSYTGLTRAAHEEPARVGSEPDAATRDDEADGPAVDPAPATADPLAEVPSPMADLPAGTAFGTLVHAVLEVADLSGEALPGLRAAAAEQLRSRAGGLSPDRLAQALLPAVSTPLGPLAGGLRLRDVPRRDLLAELAFELPLAGGDAPCAQVRLGDVAGLLRELLPPGDRVAGYAALLEEPALAEQPLRGYLTGSVDAVLRLPGPRYLVVDHKTNRLAPRDEPLTAAHYAPAALDAAVLRAHYPLQALLYDVALHRFLRWRQPSYDPGEHLGGVLYLFLRGMCGDAVPPAADGSVPGVWAWRPPAALVVALSDLLAGDRS